MDSNKKNILFNYLNDLSISHGINLQVLSYLTALGGYIKFPKNHIIVLLIILFLATSWPDSIIFYLSVSFIIYLISSFLIKIIK